MKRDKIVADADISDNCLSVCWQIRLILIQFDTGAVCSALQLITII